MSDLLALLYYRAEHRYCLHTGSWLLAVLKILLIIKKIVRYISCSCGSGGPYSYSFQLWALLTGNWPERRVVPVLYGFSYRLPDGGGIVKFFLSPPFLSNAFFFINPVVASPDFSKFQSFNWYIRSHCHRFAHADSDPDSNGRTTTTRTEKQNKKTFYI